ncbi:interleukin-1 receptor type 2-like isoform 1-T2 [Anomaloglossus baeobatrachus]|uniref:interleukin-1 receptor type 2-like n=1 Tax=Anomaloglossus baeobatrachus TaxID=238106 RepID=UPI003F50D0E1
MIWFSLIVFGTYLLQKTSGLNVYRFHTGGKCQDQITHFLGHYVLAEELATIECPILEYKTLDLSLLQLVWTRNGSEILDTAGETRIQRKTDVLWFLPAVEEDTGIYTCILRNASYCVEISMSLNVMSDTPASFPYVKYEQIAFENMEFEMICPALPYFILEDINLKIDWFKDGEPLSNDSSKYRYLDGSTSALINDVGHDDEGYYKCQLTFSLESVDYTISRVIQLRIIEQWKGQHPVILNPNRRAIVAAIGSRLVIPCKVFVGHGDSDLMVWWLANDTFLNNYSKDRRVTQGMLQATTEADGQFFERLLIFEKIEEKDFITDFKCIAMNDYGQEVLPTQIKEAASSFAWYIAAVPAFVVFLIIAIIFITKHRKCGNKNDYSLAKS